MAQTIDYSECIPSELLRMDEAAVREGVHRNSIQRWASMNGIDGRCLGRPVVHKVGLHLLTHGDINALALFREGNRTDPRIVQAYIAEGLKPPVVSEAA